MLVDPDPKRALYIKDASYQFTELKTVELKNN